MLSVAAETGGGTERSGELDRVRQESQTSESDSAELDRRRINEAGGGGRVSSSNPDYVILNLYWRHSTDDSTCFGKLVSGPSVAKAGVRKRAGYEQSAHDFCVGPRV